MKVLVIGSGAREHAIAWKLAQSPLLTKLHAAPGNAGIAKLGAKCHDVDLADVDAITALAQKLKADLVVVGPEAPLVNGLSNRLKKHEIPCVGPSAAAARIEGSKVFAKELMDRAQIPTARWEAFSDVQAAIAAINRWRGPVVVKADGLTSGKGAYVCMSKVQAERALNALLVDSAFGVAGRRVVVEEMLKGVEASVAVLTDGETIVPLPTVRVDRRRDEGNKGPNTDGMGAWTPVDELFDDQIEEAIEAGIRPALEDMRDRGLSYTGILYADVMFTKAGPKILEYNCRLGEVETAATMRSFDEDLLEAFAKLVNGELADVELTPTDDAVVAVSLVGASYPGTDVEDKPAAITGLDDAADIEDVEVFLGTAQAEGRKLFATGGRVLTVTASASDVEEAAAKALAAAERIAFEGGHFRTDVAADSGAYV